MNSSHRPQVLRFQRPALPATDRIDHYLEISRRESRFSNSGPCARLLSARLSDRVDAYCTPVASGTLGLMAALAAALPGRSRDPKTRTRDRHARSDVLMPSFTFPATAQAALWFGLRPRLLDIEPDSWHLDPAGLEQALAGAHPLASPTRPPGAVIAVSSFGAPPPAASRSRWELACRDAHTPLIVDSAAAFGALADDRTPVGAQGDIEVVSFHTTKPFAIGEGGAVFTRTKTLHERIALAANFGLAPTGSLDLAMGLNAKMSELHAATALAVLDNFDDILRARRASAEAIRRRTDPEPVSRTGPGLIWQAGCEQSTWQFLPVAFPSPGERERAERRAESRVETRVYYEPLHHIDTLRLAPVTGESLAQTEWLHERILCLPMANDLSEPEQDLIASVLAPENDRAPDRARNPAPRAEARAKAAEPALPRP